MDDDTPEGPTSRRGPLLLLGAVALALVLVVVLWFAGVFGGGYEVDEAAWRGAVEEQQGFAVSDWPQFREVWLDQCEEDDDQLELFLAVSLDQGESYDSLRTNLHYACPDRVEVLDVMQYEKSPVEVACDTPPSERDESQRRLAEAMRC